jgi:hypothetical protein
MQLRRRTAIALTTVAAVTYGVMAPVAALAAPVPSAWTVSHSTPGCPAGTSVLRQTQPAGYYDTDPRRLLPSGAATPVSGGVLTVLTHMAHSHSTWLSTMACRPGHPGRPAPQPSRSNSVSSNWSGYQAIRNNYYLAAAMEWTVHPAVAGRNMDADASIWPGIGSGSSTSDSLIQAGTEQQASCNGAGTCTTSYYPWIEIFPQEAEEIVTNLPIKPSDLIGVIVEYDPASGQAYFELDNETTGLAVSGTEVISGSTPGSGSQAEWIVERPASCLLGICNLTQLENFGTEPVINAEAITGFDWNDPTSRVVNAGAVGNDEISMYSCDQRTLLAQPSGITDNLNFTVTWKNFGIGETC